MQGFKKFILRGNVVDLAVGITVGAAFSSIATALVKDFITPLIGVIIKTPDFSGFTFTIRGSKFLFGDLLNAFISFFLIAIAVYFFIVLPMNKLIERMKAKDAPADPTDKKCVECLSEIPFAAKRCSHCAEIQPETPPPMISAL